MKITLKVVSRKICVTEKFFNIHCCVLKTLSILFQKMKKDAKRSVESVNPFNQNKPQFTVKHDGDYILVVHMNSDVDKPFEATVDIWMQGTHGYLSVVDWYV